MPDPKPAPAAAAAAANTPQLHKVKLASNKDLNGYKPTRPDTLVVRMNEFDTPLGIKNWGAKVDKKSTGVSVVPHAAEAKKHNSKKVLISEPPRIPKEIIHLVLHETASDVGPGFAPPYTAHLAVQTDGSVLQFNDLVEYQQHGEDMNPTSIGIEFVNRGWLYSKDYDDKGNPGEGIPAYADDDKMGNIDVIHDKMEKQGERKVVEGEREETAGERLKTQGEKKEAAGEKLKTQGEKMVVEGEKKVAEGEAKVEKGKHMEEEGKKTRTEAYGKENEYVWAFWGEGYNIYEVPRSEDQLEKEVLLVWWLTTQLKEQLLTDNSRVVEWLTVFNSAFDDVHPDVAPRIDQTWLQLVSRSEVENVWNFAKAGRPPRHKQLSEKEQKALTPEAKAKREKEESQRKEEADKSVPPAGDSNPILFVMTHGYDYLEMKNVKGKSGIICHDAFGHHNDGAFLALYTWLRLAMDKPMGAAKSIAMHLMKHHWFRVPLKSDEEKFREVIEYNKKIVAEIKADPDKKKPHPNKIKPLPPVRHIVLLNVKDVDWVLPPELEKVAGPVPV